MTNDEGNEVKKFSFSHTPLSRTSAQRGNVVTEKGISKLENLGISKFGNEKTTLHNMDVISCVALSAGLGVSIQNHHPQRIGKQ